MPGLADSFNREVNYIRISVTDRCNLRCFYCATKITTHLAHSEILSYEEIRRVVQAAAELGIQNVRLTGGEPLIRPDVSALVRLLSQIKGVEEVSMTTNGTLLEQQAGELKSAGLKRVNVSLDTFKPQKFKEISGVDKLESVLAGIEAAKRAGLEPIKINTVVIRGYNDDEILDFVQKSLDGWHVRFIEYMPIGEGNTSHKGMSPREIKGIIEENIAPLEPGRPPAGNGPAKYFRLPGASGTIGFIGTVSESFCDGCNRLRLTADGHLRPCLLSDEEIDLKMPLRNGADLEEVKQLIRDTVTTKNKCRILEAAVLPKKQMWQIGG